MARKTRYVPAPWQGARDEAVAERFRPPRKPLTDRHRQYLQAIEDKTVVLVLGPAGSCKTALACQVAAKLFRSGHIKRIVLTRPLVECDEEMGFLPGTLQEKAAPFIAPMLAFLKEEFGKDLDPMLADGRVEVLPLAFMRGSTLGDTFVIADECQSATYRQLKMLLTRVGEGCKMVLTGDVMQSDLDGPGEVPLVRVARQLKQHPHPDVGFAFLTRDDVLRSGLARHMDERLVG